VPLNVLAHELAGYTNELTDQAHHTEFFDLETAQRTATLCHRLLAALPDNPSEEQHRLAQLAINYFVLAEDAEDDNHSLIGFDDDLQVVVAMIDELGFHHLLEDDAADG
jgi:uncharacterized membrane protein YkvA (DUF1232 family)